MGWSTSIHVATSDAARVVDSLQRLEEHPCIVGYSGENWVGVYSQRCEDKVPKATPKLALELSRTLENYVLGVLLYEDGFRYWLFRHGKLLDQHPPAGIGGFLVKSRGHELLALAKDAEYQRKMEAALAPKVSRRPHEILGMTEEEFIAESGRELARVHIMTPDERKHMEEKYARLRPPHEEDFRTLCEALGITESSWNYSDLADAKGAGVGTAVRSRMGLRLLE
jgi:hypothetical protein